MNKDNIKAQLEAGAAPQDIMAQFEAEIEGLERPRKVAKSPEYYVERANVIFDGGRHEVEFVPRCHRGYDDIYTLANYINIVLGEYNYYTAKNHCAVTIKEAIDNKYLYNLHGKILQMNRTALLEWVYAVHPELDDEMHLDEAKKESEALLESDNIYPFFKVDTVDVNVHRRMKKHGAPLFLSKNIRGLSKAKNGHLFGEEETTRKHLFNTYKSLLKLWEKGKVPQLTARESIHESLQQK